jgi:hypothetical protein
MARANLIIERHHGKIGFWLVLGPSLVGFYPITGLINPFWGSLSGWPLHLAARGHPVWGPHPWYEGLAFFAGPFMSIALRIWLATLLLGWKSQWRAPLVLAWAASAFAVVPFGKLPTLFPGWPVWCAYE